MKKTIEKEILLPRPRAEVWQAITTSATLEQWMYPNDFEPRVGHKFSFEVPANPAVNFPGITVRCVVLECTAPSRLAFTWEVEGLGETEVRFHLEAAGDGTRLLLKHSGFDISLPFGKQAYGGANYGWDQMLGRLEAVVGEPVKMNTNPKAEAFIQRQTKWQPELAKMRDLLLEAGLSEDLKWGKPSYSYNGANLAILQPFKEYVALMFFKGALLKDPENLLVFPGENSQAGKQARYTDIAQILETEPTLKSYIAEAIEVEKSGAKIEFKKIEERPVPEELQTRFQEMPELKAAFEALTPGRQRHYLLHFSQPKQSKTRDARIEKAIPQILEGKGLND